MRVRPPVLLVVLKYVDPPSTAGIRLPVRWVGRRGVFEGIEQVPGEGKDCVGYPSATQSRRKRKRKKEKPSGHDALW